MMMTMPYAERCWGTRGEAKSEQSREEENKIDFNFFPYDSLKSFAFTVGQFFFRRVCVSFACSTSALFACAPVDRNHIFLLSSSSALLFRPNKRRTKCSSKLREWSTAKRRRRRSKMSRLSIFPMKFPQYQRWNREREKQLFFVLFSLIHRICSRYELARDLLQPVLMQCHCSPLRSLAAISTYFYEKAWEREREAKKIFK